MSCFVEKTLPFYLFGGVNLSWNLALKDLCFLVFKGCLYMPRKKIVFLPQTTKWVPKKQFSHVHLLLFILSWLTCTRNNIRLSLTSSANASEWGKNGCLYPTVSFIPVRPKNLLFIYKKTSFSLWWAIFNVVPNLLGVVLYWKKNEHDLMYKKI